MFQRIGRLAAIAALVLVTGLPVATATAPAAAASTTRTVPVLMYHRIGTPPRGEKWPDLWVKSADLDRELKTLKARGWHTITASELGAFMKAKKSVPAKTLVITFDDGRPDNYTLAFPILKKYGFKATFYVSAGMIGKTDRMTWDQLAELARAGMDIENHAYWHWSFAWATPAERLLNETVGAANMIVSKLAALGVTTTVTTFCYPYGDYTTKVKNQLARMGVTVAFTTNPGKVVVGTTSSLLAPRVRVHRVETLTKFLKRMGA